MPVQPSSEFRPTSSQVVVSTMAHVSSSLWAGDALHLKTSLKLLFAFDKSLIGFSNVMLRVLFGGGVGLASLTLFPYGAAHNPSLNPATFCYKGTPAHAISRM